MPLQLGTGLPNFDTLFRYGASRDVTPDFFRDFTCFRDLPPELQQKIWKHAMPRPEILSVQMIDGIWGDCCMRDCNEPFFDADDDEQEDNLPIKYSTKWLSFVTTACAFDLSRANSVARAIAIEVLPAKLPTFKPFRHEIRFDPVLTSIYIENLPSLLSDLVDYDIGRDPHDRWLCINSHKGENIRSLVVQANWFVVMIKDGQVQEPWYKYTWVNMLGKMFPDLEEIIVIIDEDDMALRDYEDHEVEDGDSEDDKSAVSDAAESSCSGEKSNQAQEEHAEGVIEGDCSSMEEDFKQAYVNMSSEEIFDEETAGTSDPTDDNKVPLRVFKQPPKGHSRVIFNRFATLVNDHFDNITDDLVTLGYWGGTGKVIPKLRFHEPVVTNELKLFRLAKKEPADRCDFDAVFGFYV